MRTILLFLSILLLSASVSSSAVSKDSMINVISRQCEIAGYDDCKLVYSICRAESSLNPKSIGDVSKRYKAYGLCQLQERTGKDYQSDVTEDGLLDPNTNVAIAIRHIKWLQQKFKLRELVIDGYNRGRKTVLKSKRKGRTKHVRKVIMYYKNKLIYR